ncbi:hypothetical protein WMY93_011521 [Mugilogobius chulae]|uniref:Uncharacterized protein n=1 Tax=Mugilogobius chulae TaxID=88201 RepID=A0AAW0P321_9GOBI
MNLTRETSIYRRYEKYFSQGFAYIEGNDSTDLDTKVPENIYEDEKTQLEELNERLSDYIEKAMRERKHQKYLFDEQIEAYKRETTEFSAKKATLESEINSMKETISSLQKNKEEKQVEYEKEKDRNEKNISNMREDVEQITKTKIKRLSSYSLLKNKKEELDEEIKEYRELLDTAG